MSCVESAQRIRKANPPHADLWTYGGLTIVRPRLETMTNTVNAFGTPGTVVPKAHPSVSHRAVGCL
jgi:hypothetical protein